MTARQKYELYYIWKSGDHIGYWRAKRAILAAEAEVEEEDAELEEQAEQPIDLATLTAHFIRAAQKRKKI